jgi:hypothetical protein
VFRAFQQARHIVAAVIEARIIAQQTAVAGDRLVTLAASLQQSRKPVTVDRFRRVVADQGPQVFLCLVRAAALQAEHHQVLQCQPILFIQRDDLPIEGFGRVGFTPAKVLLGQAQFLCNLLDVASGNIKGLSQRIIRLFL